MGIGLDLGVGVKAGCPGGKCGLGVSVGVSVDVEVDFVKVLNTAPPVRYWGFGHTPRSERRGDERFAKVLNNFVMKLEREMGESQVCTPSAEDLADMHELEMSGVGDPTPSMRAYPDYHGPVK